MSEGRGKVGAKSEIVVVSALKDWSCVECEGGGSLLTMEDRGPLCLDCADLAHLVYLPAGDAALIRRARKASGLAAVVVRFSRTRRRYELQGVLVEESALEQAEAECLADTDVRARHRERESLRRAEQDLEFQSEMTKEILGLFPGCPLSGPRRSPAMREPVAAAGWGAAPRGGRSIPAR